MSFFQIMAIGGAGLLAVLFYAVCSRLLMIVFGKSGLLEFLLEIVQKLRSFIRKRHAAGRAG